MITIVITGPSGSGKTYLSNKLNKLFDNSIVIKTDSYYRDNIFIRFLSIFFYDIYDRPLSINRKELKNAITAIHNKDKLITFYQYDFKRKQSSYSKKRIKYKGENQFLILEGIFAHRLDLNYQETINIICEEKKDICFKRRLIRDKLERNRNTSEVNRKFTRSWNLFYKNIIRYIDINRKTSLNPVDKISYDKLVNYLQNISKKNN
ncbi:uridine kinase [Prochlorococcus marinus]|uniref:uridine kinase family protein n=1 Tax=Prochlorococcus marinus TaxID=1219 RepID=UPI0039AED870